jgi:hydrogenase maturation factor HypF (carbamoyltransferase family)
LALQTGVVHTPVVALQVLPVGQPQTLQLLVQTALVLSQHCGDLQRVASCTHVFGFSHLPVALLQVSPVGQV